MWGALGVTALSQGAFWVAHAALLAIVIAELTRCGSQLIARAFGVPIGQIFEYDAPAVRARKR